MKIKKILSFVLVLAMLVGMFPGMSVTASAATSDTTEIKPAENAGEDKQGTGTMEIKLHIHTLTYSLATTATEDDTIVVTCTDKDYHADGKDYEAKLVIAAPTEGGGAASITDADGIRGTAKVMYQTKKADGTWDTATDSTPSASSEAAFYKASITLSEETAYVTYGVNAIKTDKEYSAESDHGTVTVPDVAIANATVTIKTTPATGYKLKELKVTKANSETVDVTQNGNNGSFTMPEENVTVSAEFEKIPYTISFDPMSYGTVSASKNGNPVSAENPATYGDTITLTATPDSGFALSTLTVKNDNDDVSVSESGNSRTFTMPNAGVTVSATFEGQPFGITTDIAPAIGGTVGITGSGVVTADDTTTAKAGTEVTLNANAATGFTFGSFAVKTAGGETVTVTDGKFTMPTEAVTVSAAFVGKDTTVRLDPPTGGNSICAASLLDSNYKEVTSLTKKAGEMFILLVNRDTDYDFDVAFSSGGTVSLTEFTTAEYDAYAKYAKENDIAVSSNMVLAWVTMPGVTGDSVTMTVTFSKVQPFTILYQPSDTDTAAVWCKFTKTVDGTPVTGSSRMHNDAVMGDGTKVFSLKVTAAFSPDQVDFATSSDGFGSDTMKTINESTAAPTQDSDWTTVTGGSAVVIGGNAKTVIAAFVTDSNAVTVYNSDDVTVDEAKATGGVTYRLAVVTENGGTVTPGTVTAPAAPLNTDNSVRFAGWRSFQYDANGKASEKIYGAGANDIPVRENTVFNAVWEPVTLTVKLNLNGGTGINNLAFTVNYNDNTTLPGLASPTRDGFAFEGWKTSKRVTEDGKLFAKGSPFNPSTKITNDLELTAQWKHVHSYTCYKISDFGLTSYAGYEDYIHVAVCGCNDIRLEAHSLDSNGVCACGYGKTNAIVSLKYSYGQWTENSSTYTPKTVEETKSAKKGQETSVYAPDAWGELNFSKWQYSTDGGGSWNDLTASPMVSFIIPCDMRLRALYVNDTIVPQVDLSARAYDDQATVNGRTVTEDNILFQANYKLPDGYTFVDAGIRMGDNAGISYYELKERTITADSKTKAALAGFAVVGSLISVSPQTVDYSATDTYYEAHKNSVLAEMTAETLAKYMYESKPINVEKYDPIYWEAKANATGMSGSIATLPPLRFAQKDNQNHWIYGIGWLRYKKPDGTIETIYTPALATTVNGVLESGTSTVKKQGS